MKEHGVETPFVFQGKTDLRDCLKNGELDLRLRSGEHC